VSTQLCDDKTEAYALDVPVPAELAAFDISISVHRGAQTHELARVADVLAGDGYLINGQSNAVSSQIAADTDPSVEENTSSFIRTLALNSDDPSASQWLVAEGPKLTKAHVGQWPLRMAAKLSQAHQVPIALFNGAEGGEALAYFTRNDKDPTDLATNYGRMLQQTRSAGFDRSLRAVFWYQGEADANSMTWGAGFRNLYATWLQDYSGVERYYMTQVHTGCTGDLRYVQEDQRRLPDELLHMGLMSTNGLDAQDTCHFYYAGGYREIGDRYAALVDRDLYGVDALHVEPPNPHDASLYSDGKSVILRVRDPAAQMVFQPGAEANFVVTADGTAHTVTGGSANGVWIYLYLDSVVSGTITVSYLGHAQAGPWVIDSTSNIGLLVFTDLPVMQ
jgi:hypothetical protein